MAALSLSGMDVVLVISQQNVQVAAGQIGQQPAPRGTQFQLTVKTLGRLVEPEQFADIIIKSSQVGGQGMTAGAPSSGGSSGQSGSRNARGSVGQRTTTGPDEP